MPHKLVKNSNTPLIVYKSSRKKVEDLARAVDGETINLNLIDLEPSTGLYYFGIGKLISNDG